MNRKRAKRFSEEIMLKKQFKSATMIHPDRIAL
jgi:hypothetical protein